MTGDYGISDHGIIVCGNESGNTIVSDRPGRPARVSITQTGDELTLVVNEQRFSIDIVGAALLVDSGSKALLNLIQRARHIEGMPLT